MNREKTQADIGLGANLGDAQQTVVAAIEALRTRDGLELVAQSKLYRSEPVAAGGPDYINAVVRVLTQLSAPDLLGLLQQLERRAGRVRSYRNAPRTLDLDLLNFGQGRIWSKSLTVPHPRMRDRAFVLWPLRDIDPDLVTQSDLESVSDQRIVPIMTVASGLGGRSEGADQYRDADEPE